VDSMLDKLKENRTPILLAEIGAYLHLIGRFSEDFIRANADDTEDAEKSFSYQKVCKNQAFFEDTGLVELLNDDSWEKLINDFKNLGNAGELSSNRIKNFCDFIEKHTWGNDPKGLCRILADAHGIISGIDKGLAGRGESGKQKKAYTFRATAFGCEKVIELIGSRNLNKVDNVQVKEIKKEFFKTVKEILENIKQSGVVSFENYLVFTSKVKEYYPKTIGETRRPINEVSLYDYAHTIASLVKSNFAKMVIDGWYEPKGKSKWRILRINVDVLGLLSKGLKVGDILGYKKELEETYHKIKEVIEFEHPLGNEIYRDSTGIYFSCPDVDDIGKLKSEIIEKLKGLNRLDFSLQIEISDSSRSIVILASEIEKSLKRISYPHIGDTENLKKEFEESQNAGGEDICPVCRIRLKPEEEDRCEKCKDRYVKRAKTWLNEEKALRETMWLDEVADKNDRIALIVGQFDLRKWLSGEFIDTFVSQTFDEWRDSLSKGNRNFLEKNMKIQTTDDLETFFRDLFSNNVKLVEKTLEIIDKLIFIEDEEVAEKIKDPKNPNRIITKYHPDKFDANKHMWNPIAERDATGKALTLTNNSEKAKHLVRLLFRKHPSLARIFRIWKTTQEFINETIFKKILKKYDWDSEPRRQRIQFKIEPNPDIPEGSTCDIDVDGVKFSPVCIDRQNGIFVSTINLEILKKFGNSVDSISKNLNERGMKVKTERDKTWKNEKNGQAFKITEAKPADEKYQEYLPFVKIYDFPDQFMVLVPAYEALDIAEQILNEYEIQFSKVRDRLPFHLGIIAFHRRTPLYVVMDAGRRLLEAFNQKTQTVDAEVIKIRENKDEKSIELKIKAETYASSPFKWKVSYSTGDPEQEDLWHPYVRFKGSNPGRTFSFDYTGNGNFVVHIKEIRPGDVIEIEPSYFKLLYLENAANRFNVGDDLRLLHDITRLQELWEEIEKRLSSKTQNITQNWNMSQIYAFWEDVRKRRDYGKDEFERFVKSDLVNILKIYPQSGEKAEELFDDFLQATKDGLLDLCLHWNLQIRKVKPIKEGKKCVKICMR